MILMALSFVLLSTGIPALDPVSGLVLFVPLTILPVAISLAIVRYRLYEIDRLISRTISYLIIVVMLGGVYTFGAVWLPTRLLGEQGPIFVAASTLAVAALFNPLRKRIQRFVDRRFNRSGYQAEIISQQFALKLQESRSAVELADALDRTVEEALQPSSTGIWLR